ncbi:MAG: AraC family transcriptional regulator [Oscillospiraceae bacterium]
MGNIPFNPIVKDHLSPLEEFLYEKYRLGVDTLPDPEHSPASLRALYAQYPDVAAYVDEFCRRVQSCKLSSESSYLSPGMDLSVFMHLRYLPKPPHSHQFFEILFVAEGQCENRVEETTLTLKKGDVCFVAPDVLHQLQVFNHDTVVYNILVRTSTFQNAFHNLYGRNDIVSSFFTQNLYRKGSGTSSYIICKTESEPIFYELIDRIIEEEQQGKMFCGQYMNLLFNTFILELLRRHEQHFTVGKATDNVETESITAILRYIQSNYQTLTLTEAAHFFNYSEAHLSRIIKKYSGQTFSDIIKTIRLQKAVELLEKTNLSISEIAEQMGYTDNSHFHKVFKHAYGVTPIQYRQKYLAEQEK